ncbi:MAG: proprotein convertase P-domain-containing protein [Ferruginibacter sp.]
MKHLQLLTLLAAFAFNASAQNVGIGTTTPSDQLHTTGTVRFEKYKGPTTRMVQMDSSGRLVVTQAGALFTNSTSQAIPDNGCSSGNGISSAINVTGMATAILASRIAVRINITHSYDADLRIYLYPPTGGVLVLASANGGAGDDFTNTVFTDQALISINTGTAPFTGQYRPKGGAPECFQAGTPFANFAAIGAGNIIPDGTWTLRVNDNANLDAGTLDNWSISFSGPESITTADENDYIPKFSTGNLVKSNIYQQQSGGNIGIGTIYPTAKLEVNGTLKIEGTSTLNGNTTINGYVTNDLLLSKGINVGNSTYSVNGTVRLNSANDNKLEYRENGTWKTFTKEYYASNSQGYGSAIRNQLIINPTFEYIVPSDGYYLATLEANTFPVLKSNGCTITYLDNGAAVYLYSKTRTVQFFSTGGFKWYLVNINACTGGQSIPLNTSTNRIIYLMKNEILTFAYQFDMNTVPAGALDNWSADSRITLLKVGE